MARIRGQRRRRNALGLFLAVLAPALLLACRDLSSPAGPTARPTGPSLEATPEARRLAPLPTLYPTFTPVQPAASAAGGMGSSLTPAATRTPVDFDQVVVYLRYAIPILGLERVLEGNVSSQITLRDEALGLMVTKTNQAALLLDLQQILDVLAVDALPPDCPGCVEFEFRLPVAGKEGRGWLKDPVLLASVENYFAANLEPFFPPGTILGIRRSASAFAVAHTVAVTADGQLWRWSATAAEIAPSEAASDDVLALIESPAARSEWAGSYSTACLGSPVETLLLPRADDGERTPEAADRGPDAGARLLALRCPELSLPAGLVPLYLRLDALSQPVAAAEPRLPALVPPLPLTATLYYERPDARLWLTADGQGLLQSRAITATITMTTTTVVSLTNQLLLTGRLGPPDGRALTSRALVTDTASLDPYVLLLRGDDGVVGLTWRPPAPAVLLAILDRFDALVTSWLGEHVPEASPGPGSTSTAPESGTPAPGGTPGSTGTVRPGGTVAPTGTATPSGTPTP